MRSADRERILGEQVVELAMRLGYPQHADLRHMGADLRWSLHRTGEHFTTEAVCFLFKRRPKPRLTVDYIGSPRPIGELEGKSLEGIAIALNLFDYRFYYRSEDPQMILPAVIHLNAFGDISSLVAALAEEMSQVEQSIWPTLADSWREAMGSPLRV